MADFGQSRRSMIAKYGREMTLQNGADSMTFLGFPNWAPESELEGEMLQVGAVVHMTNDEMLVEGWTSIREGFYVVIDGKTYSVLKADKVYVGSELIGWNVKLRGGGA